MNAARNLFATVALAAAAAPAADWYVSTAGDDDNAGTTREAAFRTIAHAVDVAADGDTVRVLAGTYKVSAAVSVTEALAIVGDTGDPADVVVRNTAGGLTRESGANSVDACRVFVLDNAGAVLAGVAVEGGVIGGYADRKGGNVLIDANGGTVTNCIIRNAVMFALGTGNNPKTASGGAGIACLSANGLVTHCVITNNFATRCGLGIGFWQEGGAAGVHMAGGVLRQSLVAYNATTNDNFGSAVYLTGAGTLMENCTVFGNRGLGAAGDFYPVFFAAQYVAAMDPLVRNTLIYGNVGTSDGRKLFADAWTGNWSAAALANAYSRFENCATDSELPDGLEMVDSGFRFRKVYRPAPGSSVVDAGAAMQSPVGLDLVGNPRFVGAAVDIGCCEYDPDEPGPVDDPEFVPATGVVFDPTVAVEISCTTADATIRYTTDGTEPTERSEAYAESFLLNATTSFKARAFKDGKEPSGTVAATYTRGLPTAPDVDDVAVAPGMTTATFSGTIYDVGNNLATSCNVYFAYDRRENRIGTPALVVSGATTGFSFEITNLTASTKYYWALRGENDAQVPKSATLKGSFTTKSASDSFDWYVSPSGSDANAGTTREAPFATIAHAVGVAEDGDGICVLPGLYAVSEAVVVDKAVKIAGDTGNPEDVVVRNAAGPETLNAGNSAAVDAHRVFVLDNEGAVLSGLAVERGRIGGYKDEKGGNILIEANGGTVENCIVRNAAMFAFGGGWPKTQSGGAGIACLSAKGLVTHCVITNNFATRNWSDAADDRSVKLGTWGGAAAVHMAGGILRQSLVAYNATTNDSVGSAVFLGGAGTLMENCTLAENRGLGNQGNFYPVLFFPAAAANQNPVVRNTLFYRNAGTAGSRKLFADDWTETYSDRLPAAYAAFATCATDSTLPDGLEMVAGPARVRRGFRPVETSPTVDAGSEMASPVDFDLAGNPRVVRTIDIGCHESPGILPTLLILR